MLHTKQGKYAVKVIFDRQISKTKAQTSVMLLLIPEGEEGQFYCQSALLIRTVLIYGPNERTSSRVTSNIVSNTTNVGYDHDIELGYRKG